MKQGGATSQRKTWLLYLLASLLAGSVKNSTVSTSEANLCRWVVCCTEVVAAGEYSPRTETEFLLFHILLHTCCSKWSCLATSRHTSTFLLVLTPLQINLLCAYSLFLFVCKHTFQTDFIWRGLWVINGCLATLQSLMVKALWVHRQHSFTLNHCQDFEQILTLE